MQRPDWKWSLGDQNGQEWVERALIVKSVRCSGWVQHPQNKKHPRGRNTNVQGNGGSHEKVADQTIGRGALKESKTVRMFDKVTARALL